MICIVDFVSAKKRYFRYNVLKLIFFLCYFEYIFYGIKSYTCEYHFIIKQQKKYKTERWNGELDAVHADCFLEEPFQRVSWKFIISLNHLTILSYSFVFVCVLDVVVPKICAKKIINNILLFEPQKRTGQLRLKYFKSNIKHT